MMEVMLEDSQAFGVSAREIARRLGVSLVQVNRDRRDGRCGGIPFVKVGARIIYPPRAVEEWLLSRVERSVVRQAEQTCANKKRRGAPTKSERIEAAARGITVPELRQEAGQH